MCESERARCIIKAILLDDVTNATLPAVPFASAQRTPNATANNPYSAIGVFFFAGSAVVLVLVVARQFAFQSVRASTCAIYSYCNFPKRGVQNDSKYTDTPVGSGIDSDTDRSVRGSIGGACERVDQRGTRGGVRRIAIRCVNCQDTFARTHHFAHSVFVIIISHPNLCCSGRRHQAADRGVSGVHVRRLPRHRVRH